MQKSEELYIDLCHINNLEIKILLGLTQAAIKFSFPSKDCNCLNNAVSLFNQIFTRFLISVNFSGVISMVIVIVLNKTHKKDIICDRGEAFSNDSSKPHFFQYCTQAKISKIGIFSLFCSCKII